MGSKFLVSKTPVDVEIHYLDAGEDVVIVRGKENIQKYKKDIKVLKAKFLKPNNKVHNISMSSATTVNESGQTIFDITAYNDKRFRLLFIEAEDAEGNIIKNTNQEIDNLQQELLVCLIESLFEKIESNKIEFLRSKGVLEEEKKEEKKEEEEKKSE